MKIPLIKQLNENVREADEYERRLKEAGLEPNPMDDEFDVDIDLDKEDFDDEPDMYIDGDDSSCPTDDEFDVDVDMEMYPEDDMEYDEDPIQRVENEEEFDLSLDDDRIREYLQDFHSDNQRYPSDEEIGLDLGENDPDATAVERAIQIRDSM